LPEWGKTGRDTEKKKKLDRKGHGREKNQPVKPTPKRRSGGERKEPPKSFKGGKGHIKKVGRSGELNRGWGGLPTQGGRGGRSVGGKMI